MPAKDLHHFTIKTHDVDETVAFYRDMLGAHVVDRPPFDFPGAWLQFGETMVHLYGGWAAEDENGTIERGGAAIDHVALAADDFDKMRDTVSRAGHDWRENDLPDANLWQLFVFDPNGVLIELNFATDKEADGSAGPSGDRQYVPREFKAG